MTTLMLSINALPESTSSVSDEAWTLRASTCIARVFGWSKRAWRRLMPRRPHHHRISEPGGRLVVLA